MSRRLQTVPQCRRDLVIRQVSDDSFVVKVPSRREYFSIGPTERFLLDKLDGSTTFETICAAFEQEFQETLSDDDIDEFLEIVRSRGLLETGEKPQAPSQSAVPEQSRSDSNLKRESPAADDDDDDPEGSAAGGSLLYFRFRLYDPDEFFSRWEPRLRWIWTPAFLVASALAMLSAFVVVWANRGLLVAEFPDAMRWETVVLVTATILLATLVHEYAHGLTCKHFGGEVHEVGVLVMFFIPCLYCNVSDAWMIPEKRRRLLITAAGGYADLCLWALSVFVWRLTVPGCLINYLAFIVLTVCGSRGFLNFNPLLRLDGYYLLSDGLGIPNLRSQAREYWMGHLRWLLWGATRPNPQPRGRILFAYGILMWFFALGFLDVVLLNMLEYLGSEFGLAGITFTVALILYAVRRVLKGFFKSELMKMLKTRPRRTAVWIGMGVAVAIVLFGVPVRHYASGEFEVRPGDVFQVHSPVSGFIKTVFVEDGAHVTKGQPLAQLAAPEIESQLAAKQSELAQVEAVLAKLKLGPRPEQVAEQRDAVKRLTEWCELGRRELEHARGAHEQELLILKHRIQETDAELEFAEQTVREAEKLYQVGALAGAQLKSERMQLTLLRSKTLQARAAYEVVKTQGTRDAVAEAARRERELADAQSALRLLEAGTRPEEIEAEVAHRERILHELEFLRAQQDRLLVRAPVTGVVATPRMREKAGEMVSPGLLFCTIEDASTSHVEIYVSEDDARGVDQSLPVNLKVRAIPFDTFDATVERISTVTTKSAPGAKNHVVVHCRIANPDGQLKSGMTGFGRIYRGWKTMGTLLVSQGLKYLRTEFWW